jgi:beta-N-acetylglucosaminidase
MINLKKNAILIFGISTIVLSLPTYNFSPAEAQPKQINNHIIHTAFVHEKEKQAPEKPLRVNQNNVLNCDLTKPSGLSVDEANQILKGTELGGLGAAYVEAEEKYKVNALYLIAHSGLESGWGTSLLAKDKNNLFGVSAYDWNPYGDATSFSSKQECILRTAELVSEKYLKSNGVYHDGKSLISMSHHYATDKKWANKIGKIMVECQGKVDAYQSLQAQQKQQQILFVSYWIKTPKLHK